MTFDKIRDLLVERAQQLIHLLDERDVEAEVDQVLCHLKTDEPSADDNRAPHRLHHLNARVAIHPGEERRAAFDPLEDRLGIGHCPHMKDARQIDTGEWRVNRRRAWRKNQLVVRFGLSPHR